MMKGEKFDFFLKRYQLALAIWKYFHVFLCPTFFKY